MTREAVSADDVVIKQGDEGDKFYVVDSGCFAVSVIDRKVRNYAQKLLEYYASTTAAVFLSATFRYS